MIHNIGRGGGSTATNSDEKICHLLKNTDFSQFFLNFPLVSTDFPVLKANPIVFEAVDQSLDIIGFNILVDNMHIF